MKTCSKQFDKTSVLFSLDVLALANQCKFANFYHVLAEHAFVAFSFTCSIVMLLGSLSVQILMALRLRQRSSFDNWKEEMWKSGISNKGR